MVVHVSFAAFRRQLVAKVSVALTGEGLSEQGTMTRRPRKRGARWTSSQRLGSERVGSFWTGYDDEAAAHTRRKVDEQLALVSALEQQINSLVCLPAPRLGVTW